MILGEAGPNRLSGVVERRDLEGPFVNLCWMQAGRKLPCI